MHSGYGGNATLVLPATTYFMLITHISVRGARQHNLQDISVRIPRNTLTVVTGLSGSGKSSLAFDTIYAEGQRRYVETLSAYARQFLDQIERPDVDSIEGLSPAISIEQKTTSRSPRSTVGTITEIYDYLRLLYASVGTPHCPNCGRPISRQTADQIVQRILEHGRAERVTVMAPIVRGRKGEFKDLFDQLGQQGFRARVDGELRDLSEPLLLDRRKNHTIEAVIDRILLKPPAPNAPPLAPGKPSVEKRLDTAIAKALQLAKGLALIAVTGNEEQLFSSSMACPDCGLDVPKLEPRSFSFNSAFGACPECHGLGSLYDLDPAKVITDWSKPLLDGGLGPSSSSQYLLKLIHLAADRYGIDLKLPFEDLPPKHQHILVYGPPKGEAPRTGFHGILTFLRDSIEEARSDTYREFMMNFMSATPCPVCRGKRLRPESLAVKIGGLSIADFTALPLNRALSAAINLSFTAREALVAERIRREIVERLEFLCAVGLTYLALDRNATTLSGGEGQRIRLATQIGSRLRGVLYVLDEPSIGLHQRDNNRLIQALEKLRDLGNTVLVVEHDEDTIRHADYVLDLGPAARHHPPQPGARNTARPGQHRPGRRARRRHHPPRRLRPRPRPRRGPPRRPGRRPGHAGSDHGLPRIAHRPRSLRRTHHAPTPPPASPHRQMAHHHRSPRAQSAGRHHPHPPRRHDRRHRRQRQRQEHAHQ